MPKSVLLLPLARLEVIEARDWYERRSPNLGDAFIEEVDRQIDRIANDPLVFPVMLKTIRRARLRRFPYSLFFRVTDEACFVIACFHASRNPRRLHERTEP